MWSTDVDPGPDRYAWVSEETGAVEPNRLFFAPLKDIDFGDGHIETRVVDSAAGTATLELHAHGYHYLTRMPSPAPGVSFSTNYLDLRDGDTVRIEVTGLPAGFDPTRLTATGYAGHVK